MLIVPIVSIITDIRVTQPSYISVLSLSSIMESLVVFVLTCLTNVTWGLFYLVIGLCYLGFILSMNDDNDDDDGDGLQRVYVRNDK